MFSKQLFSRSLYMLLSVTFAAPVFAQSFRVQCPTSTVLHPAVATAGWSTVLVGHCTRNDWANTGAAKVTDSSMYKLRLNNCLLNI